MSLQDAVNDLQDRIASLEVTQARAAFAVAARIGRGDGLGEVTQLKEKLKASLAERSKLSEERDLYRERAMHLSGLKARTDEREVVLEYPGGHHATIILSPGGNPTVFKVAECDPRDVVELADELGGKTRRRVDGRWCVDSAKRLGVTAYGTHPRRQFFEARYATEREAAQAWVNFCYGRPYEHAADDKS
jgi:hypothetical protein